MGDFGHAINAEAKNPTLGEASFASSSELKQAYGLQTVMQSRALLLTQRRQSLRRAGVNYKRGASFKIPVR
jgi:hypothetical protein